MNERDLFGQDLSREAHFYIFHDESEPRPNKGWLLIGLLFVDENKLENIRGILKIWRQKENYFNEIHFCDLPKSFGGEYGAKARVARHWMNAYENGLFQHAMFSCLAVNRASSSFERERFKQDYHAYNRFTAMAIKAGISYLIAPLDYDEIYLKLISDGKDRKSRPEQGIVDNFESYIPYRVAMDNFDQQWKGNQPYPIIHMVAIETFNSASDDLLQLTDVLLGSTQAALTACSKREVKQELGRMVVRWYDDLQNPPWKQQYKMFRKFNIWGFPDDKGKAFTNFSMGLTLNTGQLLLFENNK